MITLLFCLGLLACLALMAPLALTLWAIVGHRRQQARHGGICPTCTVAKAEWT